MVDEGADGGNLDTKSASQLQKEMRRSEFINWRGHPNLNEVTKMCIEYYENNFSFDQYLDDRSKKDTKFINPLKEQDVEEEAPAEERQEGSEFSFSDEDENMSGNEEEPRYFERPMAETLYKRAREEIEDKYFVM
jgi:hypothetical protein